MRLSVHPFPRLLPFVLLIVFQAFPVSAPIIQFRYAKNYDSSGVIGATWQPDRVYNNSYLPVPGPNCWYLFRKIDLGSGSYTRFELTARGRAKMGVKIDNLTSPTTGVVTIGDYAAGKETDTCVTVGADIPAVTGVHDIYLHCTDFGTGLMVLSFALTGTTTIAQARVFYVSPKGSDADSGSLAKPFRTIDRAARVMVAGDACYLRKGVYSELLRPANSGVPGSPITFQAYNNEPVVISAADRLTGWQKWQGNIYRTPMSWDMGPGYNQLYADSEQVYEARFPSINTPKSVMTTNGCTDYDSVAGQSMWCWWTFPHPSLPRNLSLPVCYGFTKGTDAPMCPGGMGSEWCGSAWVKFYSDQTNALLGKGTDAFKGATLWKEGYFTAESGVVTGSRDSAGTTRLDLRIGYWYGSESRGFISGALPLLDTENEWVYSDGYAYVWMPGGIDPSGVYLSAKRRITAVDISDRSNIVLKGIHGLGGLLNMTNSRNCIVDNCDFKYLSHFIYIYGGPNPDSTEALWAKMKCGVYVSGSDNLITKTSISFAAGAPLIVAGLRNVVDDCTIHDFGYCNSASADILGELCVIQHSSIYNAGRACIAIGSGISWSSNKLIYCDIYNSGLFAADGGTYYTYGPSGDLAEIAYNWWHDNQTSGPTSYMYFDGGGGSYIRIHHNVLFPHVRSGSFTSIAFALPTNQVWLYHNTVAMNSTDNMNYWYSRWDSCSTTSGLLVCSANNLDICDGGMTKWNFVDTTRDFHLKAGSPAINAGRTLDQATFLGATGYVGAPDLGAYEYGGADWRPGHTWGSKAWPSLTLIAQDSGASTLGIMNAGTPMHAAVTMTPRGIELTSYTQQHMTLRLFDPRGQCVASVRGMTTRLEIPLSARPGGFFIVKADVGGTRLVRKLVITHG